MGSVWKGLQWVAQHWKWEYLRGTASTLACRCVQVLGQGCPRKNHPVSPREMQGRQQKPGRWSLSQTPGQGGPVRGGGHRRGQGSEELLPHSSGAVRAERNGTVQGSAYFLTPSLPQLLTEFLVPSTRLRAECRNDTGCPALHNHCLPGEGDKSQGMSRS